MVTDGLRILFINRYVSAGEGEKSYNFVVPYEGCGSKPSCAICDSIDNILIIQQDEEVQGEFDAARKISCSRTGIEEEKKIYFKPFIVDMLGNHFIVLFLPPPDCVN